MWIHITIPFSVGLPVQFLMIAHTTVAFSVRADWHLIFNQKELFLIPESSVVEELLKWTQRKQKANVKRMKREPISGVSMIVGLFCSMHDRLTQH